MRVRRNSIYFLLILTLLLPLINFTTAAEKPNYIIINENEAIIWKVTIDEGSYEDYLEDKGYSEVTIENTIDEMFEDYLDKDVEGWKMVITEIKDEKEYDLDAEYPDLEDDEYKGVSILFNYYTTENLEAKDWKEEDKNERLNIYKADTDVYAQICISYGRGYLYDLPIIGIGMDHPIISKNVKWGSVVGDVDDEFADEYEDAGASKPKETMLFFIEQEADGIKTFFDVGEEIGNDDVGEFESISIYTDNGILKYYEWSYEGDPIIKAELEENWFIANWWIIAIVAAVAIIVVVIIVIKRR